MLLSFGYCYQINNYFLNFVQVRFVQACVIGSPREMLPKEPPLQFVRCNYRGNHDCPTISVQLIVFLQTAIIPSIRREFIQLQPSTTTKSSFELEQIHSTIFRHFDSEQYFLKECFIKLSAAKQ